MRSLGVAVSVAVLCLAAASAQEFYEIGPGDVLQVLVLGQAAFTGDLTVDTEGMLSVPFLGKVKASGMSPSELERKLTTLLADGFLRRPQVSVSVKQFRSQRVFVTGEVQRPGPYGLRPDRSLLTLLQDIGEFTPNVGHEVLVIRAPASPPPQPAAEPIEDNPWAEERGEGEDGETMSPIPAPTPTPTPSPTPRPGPALPGEVPGSEVFRVNLRELRSGYPDKDLKLQVGDTVYFPKAAQVYISGYVVRPGAYRYEEGLTVYQALALAGSATERGSGKVKIIRMVDGKRKEHRAKMTDLVLPEDTLHVPERFF